MFKYSSWGKFKKMRIVVMLFCLLAVAAQNLLGYGSEKILLDDVYNFNSLMLTDTTFLIYGMNRYSNFFMQTFHISGKPLAPADTAIQTWNPQQNYNYQFLPLRDGNFVVHWAVEKEELEGYNAQLFSAQAEKLGDPVVINPIHLGWLGPDSWFGAELSDGNLIFCWWGWEDNYMYAQILSPQLDRIGDEFAISNQLDLFYDWFLKLSNDNIVLGEYNGDFFVYSLYDRKIIKQKDPLKFDNCMGSGLTMLRNNCFLDVWYDQISYKIFCQVFNSSGSAVSAPIAVSSSDDNLSIFAAFPGGDDSFILFSYLFSDNYMLKVIAQRFDYRGV